MVAVECAPMDIGVEVSLYPLTDDFAPVIHEFLDRLAAHGELKVVAGSLGTQVVGEYERVFDALRRELRTTLETRQAESGRAALVMKVLGPL